MKVQRLFTALTVAAVFASFFAPSFVEFSVRPQDSPERIPVYACYVVVIWLRQERNQLFFHALQFVVIHAIVVIAVLSLYVVYTRRLNGINGGGPDGAQNR